MVENKIVAVIPAHNEIDHIYDVVTETKKHVDEVIVVDDASTDNTSELAEKAGATVLKHVVNLHKGASLKTGCEFAIHLGAKKIVMLDGDAQHDPKEIPFLLSKLDSCDFVIGEREFNKEMSKKSKIGNIILSTLSKFLFLKEIEDSQSGFRAFNSRIYPKIEWKSRDYKVETEMIRNIQKNNISYGGIKIKTIYHDKYKGTTALDGVKIALNMIQWRFN